jgi:hypothetical protein
LAQAIQVKKQSIKEELTTPLSAKVDKTPLTREEWVSGCNRVEEDMTMESQLSALTGVYFKLNMHENP